MFFGLLCCLILLGGFLISTEQLWSYKNSKCTVTISNSLNSKQFNVPQLPTLAAANSDKSYAGTLAAANSDKSYAGELIGVSVIAVVLLIISIALLVSYLRLLVEKGAHRSSYVQRGQTFYFPKKINSDNKDSYAGSAIRSDSVESDYKPPGDSKHSFNSSTSGMVSDLEQYGEKRETHKFSNSSQFLERPVEVSRPIQVEICDDPMMSEPASSSDITFPNDSKPGRLDEDRQIA